MGTSAENIVAPRFPARTTRTAREWLDVLSSGAGDQNAFLREMRDLFREDPEAPWEMLSQLDQYYRRKKIGLDLFQSLKSHIQSAALGMDKNPEIPVLEEVARAPPGAASARPAGAGKGTVAVGDVLRGRYRLIRLLGHAGTVTVFEAIDQYCNDLPLSSQRIAVKVLQAAATDRKNLLSELSREFLNLQMLSHPNIVRVHNFDRDTDTTFFTMELLSGSSLGEALQERNHSALAHAHAFSIIRAVGDALAYAHTRGVVHGDVNLRNIFVTNESEIRVLDFGASRTFPAEQAVEHSLSRQSLVSKPRYASCQLLEGQPAVVRDDVYGLACIAYLLLAGDHPFQSRTALEARSLNLRPRRPAGLTLRQWRVLRAGLHFDRERRPSDIADWLHQLAADKYSSTLPSLPELVQSRPRRARMSSRYLMAGSALVALGAAVWFARDTAALAPLNSWWDRVTAAPVSATDAGSSADAHSDADARSNQITPLPSTKPPDSAPQAAPAAPPAAVPESAPALASASTVGPVTAPAPLRVVPVREAEVTKAPVAPLPISGPRTSKIELVADTVEVAPGTAIAHLTVRRRGNLRGEVAFSWWTESGTAKAGADFEPVDKHVDHIAALKDTVILAVPIMADPGRRQAKNFYVVIDEPSPDTMLGARTLSMVSILAPE